MKYPNIHELGELTEQEKELLFGSAYVFEKLDGGNVQVHVKDDGTITHGLRSGHLEGARAPWAERFKKWYWTNREPIQKLSPGIYFGEFLAPHTIQYKPEFVDSFFLIDVYIGDENSGGFLDYVNALETSRAARDLMSPAPLLHRGTITQELIEELVNGRSKHSIGGEREGVVIKSYPAQLFAKAKHPKFLSNQSLTEDSEQ